MLNSAHSEDNVVTTQHLENLSGEIWTELIFIFMINITDKGKRLKMITKTQRTLFFSLHIPLCLFLTISLIFGFDFPLWSDGKSTGELVTQRGKTVKEKKNASRGIMLENTISHRISFGVRDMV